MLSLIRFFKSFVSLGIRCFYFSFCVGGWIANPYACLGITILMILVMFFLDKSRNDPMLVQGIERKDSK